MVICEKCGCAVSIGDFPFCPHGAVGVGFHTVFVPYVDHCISPNPEGELVTSNRHRNQLLKANNLDYRDRTGKPGCEV